MQNRYVADVGDFGKYGLLRRLSGHPDCGGTTVFSLGVVWYLVPNEDHNDDGKFIGYLSGSSINVRRFRVCDANLYDALAAIIQGGHRNVLQVEQSTILPEGTLFYSNELSFEDLPYKGPKTTMERLQVRDTWLKGAVAATKASEIVFFDPDNGLEVQTGRHCTKGPKYIFYEELQPFLGRQQSLIIYQHMDQTAGTALKKIQARFLQIRRELTLGCDPFALHYHRGTGRAFFVLPVPCHHDELLKRAKEMVEGPWRQHFDLVLPGRS